MSSAVVVVEPPHGPVLVSADLHGQGDDFRRLRAWWEESRARGEDPVWVSTGDWVHGPNAGEPSPVTDRDGRPLYDYPDESATLVREILALRRAHPTRFVSILGNHEQAHIGGPRTSKFHDDEAAHLEAQLSLDEKEAWRRELRGWPLVVLIPAHGVVVTHGALSPPPGATRADLDAAHAPIAAPGTRLPDGAALAILRSAMVAYGYTDGGDERLLQLLGPPYRHVVHGHDRDEEGWAPTGARASLLCTSFGARREAKAALWLDGDTRDLDRALRRLWR